MIDSIDQVRSGAAQYRRRWTSGIGVGGFGKPIVAAITQSKIGVGIDRLEARHHLRVEPDQVAGPRARLALSATSILAATFSGGMPSFGDLVDDLAVAARSVAP